MAQTDAFVSCNLCGATFVGEVLPQHPCTTTSARHSTGIYPTPAIFPTPMYIPPTLTLRDYFAGQAIVAYWMPSGKHETHGDCSDAADFAYGMADAMLKAREAKPPSLGMAEKGDACPECDGTGTLVETDMEHHENDTTVTCYVCGGTG